MVAEVRVEVVAEARELLHRHARRAGEVRRLALGKRRGVEHVELAQLHEW